MSSGFLQPKNALLRAEELVSVGQKVEAFETLHRTITDKRFKYMQWDGAQQQEVVLEYARLATELDTVKQAREGLLVYRNHCQHATNQLAPLHKVLVAFRDGAEQRVLNILQNGPSAGSDVTPSTFADFESGEQLQRAALSAETSVTEHAQQVKEASRLFLDVCKTILDIIKTTPKLHKLYHDTTHRAFAFCCEQKRPADFRRICENVRNHYLAMLKQKAKPDADAQTRADYEELKKAELHIETRLIQLKAASSLELWREAMQTIEDLFNLGIIELSSKRAVLKSKSTSAVQLRQLLLMSLATYYDKLVEIFGRAGYHQLHALAFLKWLSHTHQHNKTFTEATYSAWASLAVLAVLAVPVTRGSGGSAARQEEQKKLTALLGHPIVPTRDNLLSLLKDHGVLQNALPEVRELFETIEGPEFLPFAVVEKVSPLLASISASLREMEGNVNAPGLAQSAETYIDQLRDAVLRKLVLRLSEVYETISMQFFWEKVCPESFMPWTRTERALVCLADECQLILRLDFVRGIIRLAPLAVDSQKVVSDRLAALSSQLMCALQLEKVESEAYERELALVRSGVEKELELGAERLKLLDRRRHELAKEKKQRDETLSEMLKLKQEREQSVEAEKAKALAAEKRQIKQKEEAEAARLECAKFLVQKMKDAVTGIGGSPATFLLAGTSLTQLTPEALVTRRIAFSDFESALEDYQAKARQEAIRTCRNDHRKLDHLCRALRLAEAKKVEEWQKRTAANDEVGFQEALARRAAEQEAKLTELVAKKTLLAAAKPLLENWVKAQNDLNSDEVSG